MKNHYASYTINKKNSPKKIYKKLSINNIPIIKMDQIHSNIIHTITNPPNKSLTTIPNTDGLITNLKKVGLAIKFADCMPIIIQAHDYLCVLHSGRKGTTEKILTKAIQHLKKLTQKDHHFHIWFGPHICNTCYEINAIKKTTYNMLTESISQLKSEIDLTQNKLIIETDCTNISKHYFSYRGDKQTKKRNYIICYQI